MNNKSFSLIPLERIERRIMLIRGQKVMLSADLAELYDIEPRSLIQAVKRNMDRFPSDFIFKLNNQEFKNLKSQIVISSWGGLRRANPYAFTEQGVAMLSSVLRSKRAVQVNIAIMRAFVRLRRLLSSNAQLARMLEAHDRRLKKHGEYFIIIFKLLDKLALPTQPEKKGEIGFQASGNK